MDNNNKKIVKEIACFRSVNCAIKDKLGGEGQRRGRTQTTIKKKVYRRDDKMNIIIHKTVPV